jgi:hypothetical protein
VVVGAIIWRDRIDSEILSGEEEVPEHLIMEEVHVVREPNGWDLILQHNRFITILDGSP